jgi:hypothetical protein
MRTPAQARTREELVAAALEVIKPPANQREAVRAKVIEDIEWLCEFAQAERIQPAPAAGELKNRLHDYLETLRAAKRQFVRWPTWRQGGEEKLMEHREQFLAHLDAEIERVEARHDSIQVRRTGRQQDRVALAAVDKAAFCLNREQRKRSQTGEWHRLAQLYFGAATGEFDRNLFHLLRKVDRERPRRRLLRWP